ncbi:amidohydrolase [Leucobacter luti]|uniref:Imidazolonepropionase-like amidohydrolase n=1 Tax=Leucobacter luti TaxID=340320 RepID=A0A4Q7TV53_9MICO|nr:amidohydrolase [Leucobacter luti]MBL3698111.1 amidohydrolase [Leucobacter luti]RZT64805.1 hypothetical protein EV139_2229 [Leucobacter luti]
MTMRAHYRDAAGAVRLGELRVADDGAITITADHSGSGPVLDAGLVTGTFTDWHVHLQLIDERELDGGSIGRVLDLGGNPAVLRALSEDPGRPDPALGVRVDYAGAFITAPGGYPSDREWAPAGSTREVSEVDAAVAAVAEMARHGANHVKVASNGAAGPVLSDEVFSAIVAAAGAAGLPVVAHAEGPGEALRAYRLGARVFAHTPFTERLNDAELRAFARDSVWISTLDIHGWGTPDAAFEIARDNLAGFAQRGGRVRYGTDLGNGPLPVGLNRRELRALGAAGLTAEAQLAALTPRDPVRQPSRLLLIPGDVRGELDVAATRPLSAGDLSS